MIVIENNYNTVKHYTCSRCKSVLGISINDIEHDIDGDAYIKCPLCGYSYYVDEYNFFKNNTE